MAGERTITVEDARAEILAGKTVRVVVGPDPEDPTCLLYLDKCREHDFEPMIYSDAVGGWSAGVKEAVCEPDNDFIVGFMADPPPLSISVTEEAPPRRESPRPVLAAPSQQEQPRCGGACNAVVLDNGYCNACGGWALSEEKTWECDSCGKWAPVDAAGWEQTPQDDAGVSVERCADCRLHPAEPDRMDWVEDIGAPAQPPAPEHAGDVWPTEVELIKPSSRDGGAAFGVWYPVGAADLSDYETWRYARIPAEPAPESE